MSQKPWDMQTPGHRGRALQSVFCLTGAAVLTVAMLVLSHLPNDRVPAWVLHFGDDKARHLLAYAAWAALLLSGSQPWWPRRGPAAIAITSLAAAFSALDEWLQPWSGRTRSFWDFSASVLGAVLGCATILGWELLADGWGQKPAEAPIRGRTSSEPPAATPPSPDPSDPMRVH